MASRPQRRQPLGASAAGHPSARSLPSQERPPRPSMAPMGEGDSSTGLRTKSVRAAAVAAPRTTRSQCRRSLGASAAGHLSARSPRGQGQMPRSWMAPVGEGDSAPVLRTKGKTMRHLVAPAAAATASAAAAAPRTARSQCRRSLGASAAGNLSARNPPSQEQLPRPSMAPTGEGDSAPELRTRGKAKTKSVHHLLAQPAATASAAAASRSKKPSSQSVSPSAIYGSPATAASVVNQLQEADDEIQKLNQLGLGEDISPDEFLKYFNQLPYEPSIDLYTQLDDKLLTPLYERHARYRLKYLKLSQNASKDKLDAELKKHNALDLLEKDFSGELLSKMSYLEHFERDGSLDWFFDSELCRIQVLDDYQRLMIRNHDGFEYEDLDKYCKFFHSYETGQEYLDYCKELSKKLKWMEDYVHIEGSSRRKISTRGAYQAIKIATGFLKITPALAYIGYYECLDKMRFYAFWLKDLDDVYFEIWLRVTKEKKSFRNALEEVYKLDKFPSRQKRMKYALENENGYSEMEMEFCTCTTGVTSDVTEDEAHKLIAEAIKKVERPTLYEHYVRKKIAIAQFIGLVTKVQPPSAMLGQQVEV